MEPLYLRRWLYHVDNLKFQLYDSCFAFLFTTLSTHNILMLSERTKLVSCFFIAWKTFRNEQYLYIVVYKSALWFNLHKRIQFVRLLWLLSNVMQLWKFLCFWNVDVMDEMVKHNSEKEITLPQCQINNRKHVYHFILLDMKIIVLYSGSKLFLTSK